MRKLLLVLVLLVSVQGFTQAQKNYNYPLKAAYIYQFTKFIDWKSVEDTTQVFIIGVLGSKSGIYPYLLDISQRHTIKSKVVVISEIVFADQLNEISKAKAAEVVNYCDILFVPEKNAEYLGRLLEVADNNTLLIGESPNFAEDGGAINFVEYDNRLQFELNKNAILRNGFKVSNQLLKLAILIDR